MIQKFKKIFFVMLIIVLLLGSMNYVDADYSTKGWTFSDVQHDQNGTPYVVGTDKYGKQRNLTWSESTNTFRLNESTTSGTGQQTGTIYEVSYDEYSQQQSESGKTPPSKESLTNQKQSATESIQQQYQEQAEKAETQSKNDQKAIEQAHNGEGGKYHNPDNNTDYYLTQVDGEWVVVWDADGSSMVAHWVPSQGAFYYDDGKGHLFKVELNGRVMNQLKKDIESKGGVPPTDDDLIPKDENGVRNAGVAAEDHTMDKNVVLIIRQAVALWFYVFRYFSIAIMLVILIVLGIKLAITSVASEKATYKKMLVDWFVGLIIIFVIHYLMIAIVYLNQRSIDMIKDTANRVYSEDKRVYVSEDAREYGSKEYQSKTTEDIEISLYESVRTRAFDAKLTNGCIGMVLYACLVYFAYKFTFIYLKRMLNIIILTIMAPLVGLSFAFNKIMTGKATIFKKWFREYFTIVFIQTFHALIYVTFVMGTLRIALSSVSGIIFALLLLKYMSESEKIIRNIFGMDSNAVKDLAGTMEKGPSDYVKSLGKAAGTIIGIGAVGQTNKILRKAAVKVVENTAIDRYRKVLLDRANKSIDNKDDLSSENLENPDPDRDYVSEVLDYSDEDNLTDTQQEFKDIVESEQYLDAIENGEEYEGEPPKYQSRQALLMAKARLANDPKVVMAAMKQRIHNAFDFRTYTERYIKTNEDGTYEVAARLKSYEKDSDKYNEVNEVTRNKIYKKLIKKQFSIQQIIGYTKEDKEKAMEGLSLIASTAGGFFGSVIAMGALADSSTLGFMGIIGGQMAFNAGIDSLREDNVMQFLPANFADDKTLSAEELEILQEQVTDGILTASAEQTANNITRRHPTLARRLSAPVEFGLMATTLSGKFYRDVAKQRWQFLNYDILGLKKALEKQRLIIIKKIENENREEREEAHASLHGRGEVVEEGSVIRRRQRIEALTRQLGRIDQQIAEADRRAGELNQEEFLRKYGYITEMGGIGSRNNRFVAEQTQKAIKAVEKSFAGQKAALWKKIKEDAEKERREKNSEKTYQAIRTCNENGKIEKIVNVKYEVQESALEPEKVVEETYIPAYDVETCFMTSGDKFDETDKKTRESTKDAADEAFEEWQKNCEEAEKKRKQKEKETGETSEESSIKPPAKSDKYGGAFAYKVSFEDVKVAIINAAARENKSVRKFQGSKGGATSIKSELLKIIARIYSLSGEMPSEVVNYVNSLDSVIAYARAGLVASEAAASAIGSQIKERGQDGVDVEEATHEVEAVLTEYFEEVKNEPLPDALQKHDYLKTDEIIEEAGYDTIEGLAQKAMNQKLEDIESIIRLRNSSGDENLSPETAEVISKLRELAQNVFSEDNAERLNRQDDERVSASTGLTPDDIIASIPDGSEGADKSEEPDGAEELVEAEIIAANQQKEAEKAKAMAMGDSLDGGNASQPGSSAGSGSTGDDDNADANTGDELADALKEAQKEKAKTEREKLRDQIIYDLMHGNTREDDTSSHRKINEDGSVSLTGDGSVSANGDGNPDVSGELGASDSPDNVPLKADNGNEEDDDNDEDDDDDSGKNS